MIRQRASAANRRAGCHPAGTCPAAGPAFPPPAARNRPSGDARRPGNAPSPRPCGPRLPRRGPASSRPGPSEIGRCHPGLQMAEMAQRRGRIAQLAQGDEARKKLQIGIVAGAIVHRQPVVGGNLVGIARAALPDQPARQRGAAVGPGLGAAQRIRRAWPAAIRPRRHTDPCASARRTVHRPAPDRRAAAWNRLDQRGHAVAFGRAAPYGPWPAFASLRRHAAASAAPRPAARPTAGCPAAADAPAPAPQVPAPAGPPPARPKRPVRPRRASPRSRRDRCCPAPSARATSAMAPAAVCGGPSAQKRHHPRRAFPTAPPPLRPFRFR